jgi:uncharacterized protein YbjT (DUF2867 family)
LIAAKKHEITILSRKVRSDPETSRYVTNEAPKVSARDCTTGVAWRGVNYNDKNEVVEALRGIHTVLSFIQLLADPENKAQKNLIDAAIVAGVKRFAPSEWGR